MRFRVTVTGSKGCFGTPLSLGVFSARMHMSGEESPETQMTVACHLGIFGFFLHYLLASVTIEAATSEADTVKRLRVQLPVRVKR